MKTRQGFVSNSSSSSFVLASPANKDTHKIVIEIPLEQIGKKITTKAQLDEEFPRFRDLTDLDEIFNDEYIIEEYQNAVKALEENKVIWLCEVSSEDYDGGVAALYKECDTGLCIADKNPNLEAL